MRFILFFIALACSCMLEAQNQSQDKVLPSFTELDSVDVKVRGKGAGKNATITYVSYVKTGYGVDTVRRKSPALDSLKLIVAAKEAYDNALGYYRRASDATFNVWQQIQFARALETNQKLFKSLSKDQYEAVTWSQFGRQFVGNWRISTTATEYVDFSVELDGTVKLTSASPKNKTATPKFDVLADVRVVVSNVAKGKPVTFDFVAQGLFWSMQTGYFLQRMP